MNDTPETNEETVAEAAPPAETPNEAKPETQAEAQQEHAAAAPEHAEGAAAPAESAAAVEPESDADADAEVEPLPAESGEQPFARRLELILEALLLAADGPLPLDQMQKLVASEFNLGRKELRAALERMSARYAHSASELQEVATGWRLQVRSEYGEWIGRLWQEKPPRYSRALLETLALIVYRQPITRGEIEDVRGVSVSSNILKTLLERGWVREVGHKEVPGRPALYGTTPQFLDDFNLKSLDQLPALPEIKDLEQLEAAVAKLGNQSGAEAVAAAAAELRAERQAAEEPIQSSEAAEVVEAPIEQAADPAESPAEEAAEGEGEASSHDEFDQRPADEAEPAPHDEPADH